jgi:hypothetical protein
VCILFTATVIAQNTNAGKAAIDAPKFPVSGTVKDAVTKKGIVGVRVAVENFSATITDENGILRSMSLLINLRS